MDAMMLAAARSLAENSPILEDSSASLLPPLTDIRRVAVEIAMAVGIRRKGKALLRRQARKKSVSE
jgi:malate dehydrogenase (oxaloacetate-decarboxylating)